MLTTSLLLALALAADPPAGGAVEPTLTQCMITSIDNQPVPATEAGMLVELLVTPGSRVEKGQKIGQIDDMEAKAMLNIKELEYTAAKRTADSDIDIRHSEAAAKVAKAAHLKLKEANNRLPGSVTFIDLKRAELEFDRSKLGIEKAREERVEAGLSAKAKQAEVEAAKVALARRIIRAPFNGTVTTVMKKPGAWVSPGDPVVQIVGVKRLNVQGNLDARNWNPSDVRNRKVTVEVELPGGKPMKVPGRVTFVSPVVVAGNLRVMAEIVTPMQDNLPLVPAGVFADMTIHVNQPAVARVEPTAPRERTPVLPASNRAADR